MILTYHDDDRWDARKADTQYHFHDADVKHQWQRGYWKSGKWYGGF